MSWLTGVLLAAGLLLIVTGGVKLRAPAATILALRSLGFGRLARASAILLATVEVLVGSWVVLVGGPVAALVSAGLYFGFCIVVVIGLLTGRLATCGCSANGETPPTKAHAVLNLFLAAAAAGAAVTGEAVGVIGVAWSLEAVVAGLFVGLLAFLAWLVIAELPGVMVAGVEEG